MRILTGDECGLLKEIIPELSRCNNDGKGPSRGISQPAVDEGVSRVNSEDPMTRSRGIVDMSFIGDSSDESSFYKHFCTLRVDGSVEQWKSPVNENDSSKQNSHYNMSAGQYSRTYTWQDVFHNEKSVAMKNRGRTVALVGCSKSQVLACATSMGKVSLLDTHNLSKEGIVAHYDAFQVDTKNNSKITLTKGSFENRDICTAMAMDSNGLRLALGGRERETILLDMETGKQIWKAKNLKRDAQTLLEQPIWGTAIEFLSTDSENSGNSNMLVVGTAYKELRVYDVRSNSIQRRPIMHSSGDVVPHRITAICNLTKKQALVVGDAAGYMQAIDMRYWDRGAVGRFNGPCGSIRQILAHPTLDILACVGLDRMLRTYNTTNRRMLDCVYLKQRLNTLLFYPDPTWDNTTDTSTSSFHYDSQSHNLVSDDNNENGNIEEEDDVRDYIDSSDEEQSQPKSSFKVNKKRDVKSSSSEIDSSYEEERSQEESEDDFESESDDDDLSSSSEDSAVPTAKRRRS